MSSLWQSFVSGVVDSSRSMFLFCTPSLATFSTSCYQLDSNLANVEATVAVWVNSGSFFCSNSMVARVQWAFQVSHGTVETLFRWNGKRLHRFAVNLFRKLCTKFYQHRPSFIEDITKKTFWSLFLTQCIHTVSQYKVHPFNRWHFCVNMGFGDEDRILTENL